MCWSGFACELFQVLSHVYISRKSVVVSDSAKFSLVRFLVVQVVICGVGLVLHGTRPSVL